MKPRCIVFGAAFSYDPITDRRGISHLSIRHDLLRPWSYKKSFSIATSGISFSAVKRFMTGESRTADNVIDARLLGPDMGRVFFAQINEDFSKTFYFGSLSNKYDEDTLMIYRPLLTASLSFNFQPGRIIRIWLPFYYINEHEFSYQADMKNGTEQKPVSKGNGKFQQWNDDLKFSVD